MNKEMKYKITLLALMLFSITIGGCTNKTNSIEVVSKEPVKEPVIESTTPTKPVELPTNNKRKDGEQFEETIILEGMEEKVQYEHVVNKSIGFEMDYDYESFTRTSKNDMELFISVYDDIKNPENYLEITQSKENVDATVDSIIKALSKNYKPEKESYTLDKAGECIRIGASFEPDGIHMPDQLQTVYVIPTKNGSIVATEHYAVEASEGFGRRFTYIMNTLEVID